MRLPIVVIAFAGGLAAGPVLADTARINSFYGEAKGGLVIPFDSV